jgi:histidinol dehydrogenase
LKIIEGFEKAKNILSREAALPDQEADVAAKVKQIVDEVKTHGDAAVYRYNREFDGVELSALEITRDQITAACDDIDPELFAALELAAKQIKSFHKCQKDAIWKAVAAMKGRQRVRSLGRVGLYVPGGSASYPSSVLMTAIPARVAGVKEIIMATPSASNGRLPVTTLAASYIAGVDRIFAVGGAQAVAAMAFGTESIPRVDKICGPGNEFVTMAKKMVYGSVDIDGLQGPSEVFIIADENADAGYCAAELLAQAEHDSVSSALMVTPSYQLTNKVMTEINKQLPELKRRQIIEKSLGSRGVIAVVANIDEAIKLANLYAPEHLVLLLRDAASYLDCIENAGCVFTGDKATVALGDYVAGPSHALPTGGTARFASPLNINDFIKFINVVDVDIATLRKLGAAATIIAGAEGFDAHARAVEKRWQ